MRKSNILCKSLSTVESLGSVDVIASDKTGTLTLNVMTAVNVAFGIENRYSVEEALELVRKDVSGAECVKALAAIAAVCNDAEYEAEKGDGDYHDNMNGSIYMQWLNNRLLVAFNKRYPRQKMVLVLDNASYHHPRGEDWIGAMEQAREPWFWFATGAGMIHSDPAWNAPE